MMSSEEGWTIVTHRRRPQHFTRSPYSPPRQTNALSPLSLTYAQIVQSRPTPPTNPNTNTSAQPNPASHTMTDTNQTYVQSPHSPTMLRFPPNPHFREWWGRCFRCTKKGHIASECQQAKTKLTPLPNPKTKLTQVDHPRPRLDPSAAPFIAGPSHTHRSPTLPKRSRPEPSFEEFLGQPEPHQEPQMPANRPNKLRCYFNRDESYYSTLDRMLRGIVVHPPRNPVTNLSLDDAAATVSASAMVTSSQLQVARLSHRRFLVLLPPTLDRDKVVSAIPKDIWDQGYSFHSYSPLSDTSISVPLFKLWIDIKGVPLELQNEAHIARAVSSFGLYLGSMEPSTPGDCHTWSVFLATDDLSLVPHEMELKVGGMVYTATICPRKWIKGQIYHRQDLPPTSVAFHPPASPQSPSTQTLPHGPSEPLSDPAWFADDDVLPMSLTALREIFRDVDPASLPYDLANCLAGSKKAIAANHDAARQWEHRREENRVQAHFTHSPSPSATLDPSRSPLPQPNPTASQRPTESQGPALCQTPTVSRKPTLQTQTSSRRLLTDNNSLTVPRTDLHLLGPPLLQDLAMELCSHRSTFVRPDTKSSWDPQLLFPEIVSPVSPNSALPLIPPQKPGSTPDATHLPPRMSSIPKEATTLPTPHHPRPTARIRTEKNAKNKSIAVNLDASDFLDIPLKYAEGRELLNLIGAAAVSIPPHLIAPPKSLPPSTRLGQSTQPKPKPTKSPKQTARASKKGQLQPSPMDPRDVSAGPSAPVSTDSSEHLAPSLPKETYQPTQPAVAIEEEVAHNSLQAGEGNDPYLDTVDYSGEDDCPA